MICSDIRLTNANSAKALFRDGLCLPSGTALTQAELEQVAGVIRAEIRGQRAEGRGMEIRSAKDLIVYQKVHRLAMAICEVSKSFPPEERYA